MMLIRFLAIVLTGLALIGPAAHLFEMPNKMPMAKADYFVVQGIYNGWWILGLFFPLAIIANAAHAFMAREDTAALVLSSLAALCIGAELTIFVLFTQPANAATVNWTTQPDNWEALRRQWEFSHAVNAGITFAVFCLATAAALRSAALPES